MKNGKPEKPDNERSKPKYTIHDFKPKKRYTRAEREKIQLVTEFMEIIRESLKKNEQSEKSDV